jgi:hypothetical protein
MKVYIEFDLQDKEQAYQHYYALKSPQMLTMLKTIVEELEDRKDGLTLLLIKDLCNKLDVQLNKAK